MGRPRLDKEHKLTLATFRADPLEWREFRKQKNYNSILRKIIAAYNQSRLKFKTKELKI